MELADLIKDCQLNNVAAQKCVYDRFAKQMFLLCQRYLRDEGTAEEVMMNGFLQFFQKIGQFQYINEAGTVGWMKKIMVNECLMQIRRGHSFLQVATDDMPEMDAGDDIFARLGATEIFQLIMKLPPGYRTVFNLYAVEKYGHKEIAKMLGISEGTAKSQFHKARMQLQQLIRKQNEYYAIGSAK